MKTPLKNVLEYLLENWVEDLNPAWHTIALQSPLGFDHIDPQLTLEPWEPVFPVRKGMTLLGAPAGAHIFRAFDGINPNDVRCVILGQDPFPCPAFATGRAFEAGNVATWRELGKIELSPSMRCYLQSICTARTGTPRFSRSLDEWDFTIDAIENGTVNVPPPGEITDLWQDSGILPLNSALTISRFSKDGDTHQLHGHLPLWRPLIVNVLTGLAAIPERPVVVLIFGEIARELFQAAVRCARNVAGHTANLIPVYSPHPAAGNDFLAWDNPFLHTNKIFQDLGLAPIHW